MRRSTDGDGLGLADSLADGLTDADPLGLTDADPLLLGLTEADGLPSAEMDPNHLLNHPESPPNQFPK